MFEIFCDDEKFQNSNEYNDIKEVMMALFQRTERINNFNDIVAKKYNLLENVDWS
jgi:hypothetical protein